MSIVNFVRTYFTDHQETEDDHRDPLLMTRYYKITDEQGFDYLINLIENSPHFELKAASKEYGEVSFYTKKGKKAFIMATVLMHRPYRTSIDFSATSEGVLPFDFGYTRKVISSLYDRLDKDFNRVT